jgi:hypothetical protein
VTDENEIPATTLRMDRNQEEVEIRCTRQLDTGVCDGLVYRFNQRQLKARMSRNMDPLWSAACRRCHTHYEISIDQHLQLGWSCSDFAYWLVDPTGQGQRLDAKADRAHAGHNDTMPQEQRWTERDFALYCSGNEGKCRARIAYFEIRTPEESLEIHRLRNYRDGATWNVDKTLIRESYDFLMLSEHVRENPYFDPFTDVTRYTKYHLVLRLDPQRPSYATADGRMYGGNTYANDFAEIRGRCLSCRLRHDFPAAYRKTLLWRWIKESERRKI